MRKEDKRENQKVSGGRRKSWSEKGVGDLQVMGGEGLDDRCLR